MAFAFLACLTVSVEAFDVELGLDAISQATAIGQTGIESRRADFHRPYRLVISQPPLDYIDVVTPFRRVVLAAEARLLAGERLFGQRDALETLGDRPEQVDLRLELTFHPLNTFVGMPSYEVGLISVRTGLAAQARGLEQIPRFGPRVNGTTQASPTQGVGLVRGPTQPLLGGAIVVTFDGRVLDRGGVYEIVVSESGKRLAGGRVDLSTLR